jgi:hypothetical protein
MRRSRGHRPSYADSLGEDAPQAYYWGILIMHMMCPNTEKK